MYIQHLDFSAFGPFTQTRLDFNIPNNSKVGLHIVYGLNEAGKSSALRGLIALLYGFENKTNDNFVHANNELQVNATLAHSDGSKLNIRRRKGIKNTLLDFTGQSLPENILNSFLGQIDKQFFQAIFGIDHIRLRAGGQEILEGSGRIGEALFAAGTGFTGLRQLVTNLQTEADELFKPSGKNQKLAVLKRQYDEICRDRDAQILRGADWQVHNTKLHQAQERISELNQELTALQIEHNRLERIHRALPHIARRQELLQVLAELKDAVMLPDDFATRRTQALEMLEHSERELAAKEHELALINTDLQRLIVNQELLESISGIERLSKLSGQFDKDNKDLPVLQIHLHEYERTALNLLKDVRPDLNLEQVESELRISKAQREGIRELGNRYGAIENSRYQAASNKLAADAELVKRRQTLKRLGPELDTSALKRAYERAQLSSSLDDDLLMLRAKIAQQATQAETLLRRLWGWNKNLEQLEHVALPSVETLNVFQDESTDLLHRYNTVMERLNFAQTNFAESTRQLAALNLEGEVPTEAALQQARIKRNTGWQLIRQAWLTGQHDTAAEAAFDMEKNLLEAYEHSVSIVDKLADRLRREATQVQQQAQAQANCVHYQQEINKLQLILADVEQKQAKRELDWHDLWTAASVAYRSPKEMRDWLQQAEKLRAQAVILRTARLEKADLQQHHDELLAELNLCLRELDESSDASSTLKIRLGQARSVIQQHDRNDQQRYQLETSIGEWEHRAQDAERAATMAVQELELWRNQWTAAVKILGLASTASPTQANTALEQIETLFQTLKEAANKRERIYGINRDAASYGQTVAELSARIAPDLNSQSALSAIGVLHARLQEARKVAAQREVLNKQAEIDRKRLLEIRSQQRNAQARLNACLREAHCDNYAALPAIEARSMQRREVEREYAICSRNLLELSGGKGEIALLEESSQVNTDALPSYIENINLKIKELGVEREILNQTIGDKRAVLRNLDGRSGAADKAAELEQILAEMRTAGERYLRLRLANVVLKQQVEVYRQRNQTPLLSRASEIFAAITCGAFCGLETTFTDTDQPVLRGLRSQGNFTLVEGMSDGTRDQLFLALRLASIQIYLEQSEPIPLIIDDILVHYDDARSTATLQVLAKLAERTQVIMFTHHQHLLELARKSIRSELMTLVQFNIKTR